MAQYIDKSALVAWAKETYFCENTSMIRKVCYKQLLEYIDTLEVKDVQEEPVSEDLEEAANDYAHDLVHDDVFETFIAGAKWQEEQCQKTIELAEDHAYLAGQEKVIEKATFYIQQHWIWNTKIIEDFKNYMKGE